MSDVNSEAEKLFNALFIYAREKQDQNVNDFTEIVSGFYRRLASEHYDSGRNSMTKRVMELMKHHIGTDPRYQMRIDEVLR